MSDLKLLRSCCRERAHRLADCGSTHDWRGPWRLAHEIGGRWIRETTSGVYVIGPRPR